MSAADFRPAAEFGREALAALFTRGYAGYAVPVSVDVAALDVMVRWTDIDLASSRVALVDGEPRGLVLLALRHDRSWIGGLAVVPEHRRGGLGLALMREALAEAARRGARETTLEVIEPNLAALALYERLGFRRTRILEVWNLATAPAMPAGHEVSPVPVAQARARVRALRELPEPWQRADETVDRLLESTSDVEGRIVTREGRPVGACLVRPAAGRVSIVQLATEPDGAAEATAALLASALRIEGVTTARWLDLPASARAAAVLRAAGARREIGQHEMRLALG